MNAENFKMNGFRAVAITEGFEDAEHQDEIIVAWAYLIKTGMVWELQGRFGRTAKQLIEDGYINEKGIVNWQQVNPRIN